MESFGSRLVEFQHENGVVAPQQPLLRFPARLNPPLIATRRDAFLRRDRARRAVLLIGACLLLGVAAFIGYQLAGLITADLASWMGS
jgi:hypothetical protein